MTKPVRQFSANEGDYSIGLSGPDAIEKDIDTLARMFDPLTTHEGGLPGGIGTENIQNNALTDVLVGDRTINDVIPDAYVNTGKLSFLFSLIAKTIKALKGTTTWSATPSDTINNIHTRVTTNTTNVALANTKADNAVNTSNNANNTANTANTKSDGAVLVANNADTKANTAITNSSTALTKATQVETDYITLKPILDQAVVDANTAVSTVALKVDKTYVDAQLDSFLLGAIPEEYYTPDSARFVIGTSLSGWTSKDCDYLCDGVDDQVEINNALQALPVGGGEIKILDGTYNITDMIYVWSTNVSIVGNGNATILKRMWNSTFDDEGVILFDNSSFSRVENISIDGNKAIYTSATNAGIYLKTSAECVIANNNIKQCENGIVFFGTPGSIISNNVLVDNNVGILLDFYGVNNIVNTNICKNNNIGIYLKSVSRANVSGNSCIRGTGLVGNYTATQHTIKLDSEGTNNLVTANIVYGKTVTNLGTGNSVIDNKFDTSASELATHKADLTTDADGVHGLKIESGIWTPSLTTSNNDIVGVTYTSRSGKYIKIGNLLFLDCAMSVASITNVGTGFLTISGLPFSVGDHVVNANALSFGLRSLVKLNVASATIATNIIRFVLTDGLSANTTVLNTVGYLNLSGIIKV